MTASSTGQPRPCAYCGGRPRYRVVRQRATVAYVCGHCADLPQLDWEYGAVPEAGGAGQLEARGLVPLERPRPSPAARRSSSSSSRRAAAV